MVIPAVALKFLAGAVVCGSLATSIAVPTVMSKNSFSWPALNNFPRNHKQKFQDKCQLITSDEEDGEGKRKYLFACERDESENQDVKLYFYSEWEEPISVKELKGKQDRGETKSNRVTVTLEQHNSNQEATITVSDSSLRELMIKGLKNCGLTKNKEKSDRWTLNCPKSDSEQNKGILLTPVIIQ